MNRTEFERLIASAPRPEDRIAGFGALLSKESKTAVEIVGGSAIEIRLSSESHASQVVDLVGRRDRIAPVLRRWGFREVAGRSQRIYWFKRPIGLVDLVGRGDRSGLRPTKWKTPFGPVLVSAVEPLIVRRLMRSQRERSAELYAQAVQLARLGSLDWEYLEAMAGYEGFVVLFERLKRRVRG